MADQKLILIADDEPAFREIFSMKLSTEGFRVEVAENGKTALVKAKAFKPDLILMDVRMPVMDGPTALLKLREDPEIKDIKVVFLTSLGDPMQEIQEVNRTISKDFGAEGYLRKTDDLNHLSDEIKKLVA